MSMTSKKSNKRLLSVVVPAYKKAKTIRRDLVTIDKVLTKGLPEGLEHEIICVEDGQLDNTRFEVRKIVSKNIKLVTYKKNKGKGYAVRRGMRNARGDYVSFLDAGAEISPKGIMMLMAHMDWYDADIVVGSKKHPASKVNYPFKRKIFSWGYHFGVKILFGLKLDDTQSGIKIFRRYVIDKILDRLLVKRYAMDIEMLTVANYCGYGKIYEAPIEVHFDASTTAVSWKTAFHMLRDTLAVFYRLRILHYYDDKNMNNWIKLG